MFKKVFITVALATLCLISFSQVENSQKAKAGTYQIIIHTNKVEYAFTDEFLIYIEDKRDEEEDIMINLTMYVDLFIPSRKTINSKDFMQLSEYLHK